MIKYYFGYKLINGWCWPVKWSEENGQKIGGEFKWIKRDEIIERHYNTLSLLALERMYPKPKLENV